LLKYGEFIFSPDEIFDIETIVSTDEHTSESRYLFLVRFLAALYRHKYSPCFSADDTLSTLFVLEDNDGTKVNSAETLLNNIRSKTWHKTISSRNTVPSVSALQFHSNRFTYVMQKTSNATMPYHIELDLKEFGWDIVNGILQPIWDTQENMDNVNDLMKATLNKCNCQKSKCKNGLCKCKKQNFLCSVLCTCQNCENKHIHKGLSDEITTNDNDLVENESETEEPDSDSSEDTDSDTESTDDDMLYDFESDLLS